MSGKKRYNLALLNADMDNALLRAQEELEEAIELFGEAADAYSDANAAYDKAKGIAYRALREQGKGSAESDIEAKEVVCEDRRRLDRADGLKKKYQHKIAACTERLQSLKFIARRTDALAHTYMEGQSQ